MSRYEKIDESDLEDKMIFGTMIYFDQSRVMSVPSVVTYPEFARDLLIAAFDSVGDGESIPVSDGMIERTLGFFEEAHVSEHPEITRHPRFVRDLLKVALAE